MKDTGRGLQEAAGMVEKEMETYEELLECAVLRRDLPDTPQTAMSPTQLLREQITRKAKEKNEMKENGQWWQSELEEAF